MGNSGSDKKHLKSIFEESLKEISSEGTDEFRRSVTEILDDKQPGDEEKIKETVKKENRPGGLNAPNIQD
jgi:hypothetical protein